MSVVGCKHLALLCFFHLFSFNVIGFRNVRVALIIEQHGPRGGRLGHLLDTMVDSFLLICNICCLVIKCRFHFIVLWLSHQTSQRRKTELGWDLGVIFLIHRLDLSIGHQAVTLLVNSICYNASCVDHTFDVMMWLRLFSLDLIHKAIPLGLGPIIRLQYLPTLEEFEWLGFVYVLNLIFQLLVNEHVSWSPGVVCGISMSFISVEIFQNGMVLRASLRAIVWVDSLLIVLVRNVVDLARLNSLFGNVATGKSSLSFISRGRFFWQEFLLIDLGQLQVLYF